MSSLTRCLLMIVFMLLIFPVYFSNSAEKGEIVERFICNSGKNMRIIVSPSRATRETWLGIRFIRSPHPFIKAKPEPGECTMFRRAVGVNEPDLLEVNLRAKIWVDFSATGGSYARAGVLESVRYREDQKMAERILKVVRSGVFFTVEAYDTGKGYFKIVSVDKGIRLPR